MLYFRNRSALPCNPAECWQWGRNSFPFLLSLLGSWSIKTNYYTLQGILWRGWGHGRLPGNCNRQASAMATCAAKERWQEVSGRKEASVLRLPVVCATNNSISSNNNNNNTICSLLFSLLFGGCKRLSLSASEGCRSS